MRSSLRAAFLFALMPGPPALQADAPPVVVQKARADEPAANANDPKPNAPDEAFLNSQRQQRDGSRGQLAAVTDGEIDLSNALSFDTQGGMLEIDASFPGNQRTRRFRIKGAEAALVVTQTTSNTVFNGMAGPPTQSLSINRIDADVKDDKSIWNCHVSRSNTYISMSGQSVLGRISFVQSAQARQNVNGVNRAPPIRLSVMEWQAGPRLKPVFTVTANTIEELRSRNPEAFRQHLVPLLRKFGDTNWLMPGATDVYGVFSEIPADQTVAQKLQQLLPDLDDGVFAIREAASKQLLDLGAPGVLAALRQDRAALSDEQKGQLGRLMAAHRRRGFEDPSNARQNVAFLTDCLEYPDLAVRQTAKLSLQKVLGKEIAFDPNLSGDALAAAADGVRKQVLELAPSTQPVEADVVPLPEAVRQNVIVR